VRLSAVRSREPSGKGGGYGVPVDAFLAGGTEEQYRTTLAAVTQAVDGRRPELFHAAGPADGGILIAAVYESKQACESFVKAAILPLLPLEGGLVGPPEERGAEIVNLEGLAG
jgi:hypothetical protein